MPDESEGGTWYCEGYSMHEWELFDQRDGIRIYHCARCGGEISEETADA